MSLAAIIFILAIIVALLYVWQAGFAARAWVTAGFAMVIMLIVCFLLLPRLGIA